MRLIAALLFIAVPLSRALFAQSGASSADSSVPTVSLPDSSAASAFPSAPEGSPTPVTTPASTQTSPSEPPPPPAPHPPEHRRVGGLVWLPMLFAGGVLGGVAWAEFSPQKRRRRPGELA